MIIEKEWKKNFNVNQEIKGVEETVYKSKEILNRVIF